MEKKDKFRAGNRTYRHFRTLQTNISEDYLTDEASHWGIWEAFRESVQNLMDEAEWMSEEHGGQLADYVRFRKAELQGLYWYELSDKGRGVDWEKIFLIGESGKRGSHYRGQKGEGEVLSFLVCVRQGVGKMMFSQDWAVTGRFASFDLDTQSTAERIEVVEPGKYKVLTLDLYKTDKPVEGTIWRFEAGYDVEYYYSRRTEYFPELSRAGMRRQDARREREAEERRTRERKERKREEQDKKSKSTATRKTVFTPRSGAPARLYVRGIFVRDIDALNSYNLTDALINRDRSMVKDSSMWDGVVRAFNSEDITNAQMRRYWGKAGIEFALDGYLEYNGVIAIPDPKIAGRMCNIFHAEYGRRACVFTAAGAAEDAEMMGWKVLHLGPGALGTALSVGVPSDKSVCGYIDDILPYKKVPKRMQLLIILMQDIGERLGLGRFEVVPIKRALNYDSKKVGGFEKDGVVYIFGAMFDRAGSSARRALRVYIHEVAHASSQQLDRTREFTEWFEEQFVRALFGEIEDVSDLIKQMQRIW